MNRWQETLDPWRLRLGETCGRIRQKDAIEMGLSDAYGLVASPKQQLDYHVMGAQAEIAGCAVLRLHWRCQSRVFRSEPDAHPGVEFRGRSRSWHDLIVRERDLEHPDRYFVLVLCHERPTFLARGWIAAPQAQRDEWYRDRGERQSPCWWVPQTALQPMEELWALLHTEPIQSQPESPAS